MIGKIRLYRSGGYDPALGRAVIDPTLQPKGRNEMSERRRYRWICWWVRRIKGRTDQTKVHAFGLDAQQPDYWLAPCGAVVPAEARRGLGEAGSAQFWGPESSANEKCKRCLSAWRQSGENG